MSGAPPDRRLPALRDILTSSRDVPKVVFADGDALVAIARCPAPQRTQLPPPPPPLPALNGSNAPSRSTDRENAHHAEAVAEVVKVPEEERGRRALVREERAAARRRGELLRLAEAAGLDEELLDGMLEGMGGE
eukprot:COSAG01_NODE_4523_length_4954_cov_116.868795_2_plen_134_part_00